MNCTNVPGLILWFDQTKQDCDWPANVLLADNVQCSTAEEGNGKALISVRDPLVNR